ncbi:unnamed protein product [Adineta steineri]|uniref:Myb/SANT-like DNA-binding domain-containing protein n=3 Tax=Adineta steineri TaxID=433720 RepID=A0A814H668_9BILA|nr:unnamed protein product [Adineta steineri]
MNDQTADLSSIDSFHVGRRRKPNFTDHEVLYIIDQYDNYKECLHSREASKSVIAQKQAIWKQITDNLNTNYPQVERTVEDVRRKWKKLQSEAKRESAAYRAAQLYIIDQYDNYKECLHSREASKSVIAQKQAIWKQITDNLNTNYPQVERTVEDVRRKWKKLQSEAKRESAAYRAAQLAGTSTSISNKQLNVYNRILNICRAPVTSTSHFPPNATLAAALQHQQLLQQHHQQIQQSNMNNNNNNNHHDMSFNEQSSDKVDSPSSDLGNGISVQLDSPGDESASLLGNEDNSPSPITNYQLTSNIQSYQPAHLSTVAISNNGQISKRTLDKRRKLLKSSVNQQVINNTSKSSYGQPQQQQQQQQQNSLRYESLIKRKRTLELTSQRLVYDKERLLIERKNLDIKLATNECENERIAIEKRRTELALQKLQSDISLSTNGNHNLSDQEDHEDNNSLDDMSDINE